MEPLTRLLDKIEIAGECWLWQASTNSDGYGQFQLYGRPWRAHRASWTLHIGPIPEGLHVLHSCDTPLCINPSHLRLGTHQENMQDRVLRKTGTNQHKGKTHCKRGHEYNQENTYVRKDGRRQCNPCRRKA